jgi:hypothetical protein
MHVIATCSMAETHMSAAIPMAFMAIDLASMPGTSMSALQGCGRQMGALGDGIASFQRELKIRMHTSAAARVKR